MVVVVVAALEELVAGVLVRVVAAAVVAVVVVVVVVVVEAERSRLLTFGLGMYSSRMPRPNPNVCPAGCVLPIAFMR